MSSSTPLKYLPSSESGRKRRASSSLVAVENDDEGRVSEIANELSDITTTTPSPITGDLTDDQGINSSNNSSNSSPSDSNELDSPSHLVQSSNKEAQRKALLVARCRPVVQRLMRDCITNVEGTLNALVGASIELAAYERNMMALSEFKLDPDVPTDVLWQSCVEDFRTTLTPCIAYIRRLPGFVTVPNRDRCYLFCRALIPIVIAQLALPSSKVNPMFAMSEYNQEIMLKNFPNLEPFREKIRELHQVMKTWNPTKQEFALLCSFVFYQEENKSSLVHPDLILNIRKRLKLLLQAVLSQLNNGEDRRARYFMRCYDLLRVIDQTYVEACLAIFNQHTNLLYDDVYREMYGQLHAASMNRNFTYTHLNSTLALNQRSQQLTSS